MQKVFLREKTGISFFLISKSIDAGNILLYFKNQIPKAPQAWPVSTMHPTGGKNIYGFTRSRNPDALGAYVYTTQGRSESSSKRCEGEPKSKCTPLPSHSPGPGTPFTLADEGWESWQEPLSASAHSGLRQEEALLWVLTTAECLQPMRRPGGAPGAQHSSPAVSFLLKRTFSPVSSPLCQCRPEHGGNKTSGIGDLPLQH